MLSSPGFKRTTIGAHFAHQLLMFCPQKHVEPWFGLRLQQKARKIIPAWYYHTYNYSSYTTIKPTTPSASTC